jgi:D-alanyl-D-alanine carboxypeptidase/D-alanyl-D-alanine-endopeptidase (penicillin-binding protein 4)
MKPQPHLLAHALLAITLLSPGASSAAGEPLVDTSTRFVRLSDGKILGESQPDKLVSPASVTKLITSAAVLNALGPAHVFSTRVCHTGKKRDGTITGDMVFVGSGDPYLVSEHLLAWSAALRQTGINRVQGNLILDNSLFDSRWLDGARDEGEVRSSHAYDAPVSALAINFNSLALIVTPAERPGTAALVRFDPVPLPEISLDNRTRTTRSGKTSLSATRLTSPSGRIRILVQGSININDMPTRLYRSSGDPTLTAGAYLRAFLEHAGIRVSGKTLSGLCPSSCLELPPLEGYPLARSVEGLQKFSNNFMADMLVKVLASDSPPATLARGMERVSEFLRRDVGRPPPYTLDSGSGLTPTNRLSAAQVTAVLAYMEKRFDLFPEYLASFPTAGVDGTLKKRFKTKSGVDLTGQIRAKTGTLSEPLTVVSLAGYTHHPEHGLIAFAILQSGREGAPQPEGGVLRERQETIIRELLESL